MFTMSAPRRGPVRGGAHQMRQRRVGAIQQAEHVEFHHLRPLGQRRPGRRAEQHDPGVVNQRIQAAQLGGRPLHRGGGRPLIGDVALQHQRGATLTRDLSG
jgi:hypothetical protein